MCKEYKRYYNPRRLKYSGEFSEIRVFAFGRGDELRFEYKCHKDATAARYILSRRAEEYKLPVTLRKSGLWIIVRRKEKEDGNG